MISAAERAAVDIFYNDLTSETKDVVREWLVRGHTMRDAILRSNALGKKGELVTPRNARREEQRLMDIRQAAEHESAHSVAAQALGLPVKYAKINADGNGGECVFTKGGTKLQRAIVLMAPELWITRFRTDYFVYGAKGLEDDHRGLIEIGDRFVLREAMDHAMAILKQNRAIVLATADQIEKTGHVVLPWQ